MKPKAPLSTFQYAAAATAPNTKLAYQKDLDRFAAWAPQAEGTLLSYAVNAHVGGKLAQIGSRLVDGGVSPNPRNFPSHSQSIC